MKNRNFPWAIIAAAAVAGAGFAGVASYVRTDGTKLATTSDGVETPVKGSVSSDPLSGDTNSTNSQSKPTNGDNSTNNHQGETVSKVNTLNKAIAAAHYDDKGIRVLDVTVDNGNAIIDMNNAVRYNWGSEEEADFLNKMKDALTPFSTIKTFQIRVDGEILKYLSHFEVDPVKVR